jgi:PAS domain S-box-containing protein
MTSGKREPRDAAELRRQAEGAVGGNTDPSNDGGAPLSTDETRRTLHELQVHQIELEMQNEELRRTQGELDTALARYSDLYELAPVGYCTVSEQGLILEANLTAATLLGVPRSTLVMTPFSRFILNEDQDIHYLHCKSLFGAAAPQAYNLRMVKGDGTSFWAHLEAAGAQDAVGQSTYRVVLSDITRHKQAEAEKERLEAQLMQAQKMQAVGQLAGGVAHDFNNLLHVILGYTNALKDKLDEDSGDRHAIRQVHKAAECAAELTRQLLAFGCRQTMDPVALDLSMLVQDDLKMIQAAVGERIDILFMPSPRLSLALADRGQIEQVLMNLCLNARDAMSDGGILTIETKDAVMDEAWCRENTWAIQGRYVLLGVADTGCGMNAETRARIFEPFFTTKEMGLGTGLGLAMVYGIVNHHGGLIQVESEPGQGTTFKVYLPVADQSPDTGAAPTPTGSDGGTETILVAEDEEMVRDLLRSMLEDAGYTVLTACDGAETLRMVREHGNSINLALLDIMMPKCGAKEVSDHIRTDHPRIRILFSSACNEHAVHQALGLKEGSNLLVKPYSGSALLYAVRKALDATGE